MANQQHKTTTNKNTTKGETQIPQPDMRFGVSPSSREAKQTAKGAGPNKNNHEQGFAMDTVVKSHCVATQENAPNELVATQKGETRVLNYCC